MRLDSESGRSLNIVVVDDDPDILHIHSRYISLLGHKAVAFASPERAISYLMDHKNSADLIITDYHMPCINGVELLSRLRTSGVETPAIILTSAPSEVTNAEYSTFRTPVIAKPVKMQELNRHILSFFKTNADVESLIHRSADAL